MKFSILRKIYPYLNNTVKNRKWRSITHAELNNLLEEKQIISNCYDMAVRYALLQTEYGRACLKKRIKIQKNSDNPAVKVLFNIDGKNKAYIADNKNDLSLGKLITKAVNKMIKRNPTQKPFVSRLARFGFSKACEFNKPSHAIKWYTGRDAIEYGESGFNLTLKPYKEKVLNLLNILGNNKPKNYSFVVLSSLAPNKLNGGKKFHCLSIVDVNNKTKTLNIINKRTNEVITVGFEELINKFKGIIGICH